MTKTFLCSLVLLFSFQVHAESCKDKLLTLLASAKTRVNASLTAGSNCHNAALIGRKNGPPGCYPPDLNTLMSVLTPLFDSAKGLCSGVCKDENKQALCKEAVNKSTLKEKGIDGVTKWIKNNAGFNNVNFEKTKETDEAVPVEI